MHGAKPAVLIATVLTLLFSAAAAHAQATFTAPAKLTGPAGGEPSIATDQKGNVYVDGPQGIPSGLNQEPGIGFWASHDNGTSWGPGKNIGSWLGGGDSDVITAPDGTVYVDDLEAVAAQVCKSTDHGNTFESVGPVPDPANCSLVGLGQVGPSDDRPWLTSDPKGALYLTYHEFVSAQPLIFRSDNGGADLFTAGPCGSIVTDPNIEANVPTDITGGTLVAKPITDAAGNLYVLFTTSTQSQNLQAFANNDPSGSFSQLYVAVSHDQCKSFTDYTVYDGASKGTNTTQFGDIFNAITADGAGNLYSIGVGFVNASTAFPPVANVYLFSSHDQGQHWSGPTLIGQTNAAHMLPAAVGGPYAGQLAVGYFQTTNGVTDPNDVNGKWTYTTAESSNANSASPTFSYADVNPGFDYHNGAICNGGVLCSGSGSGDRSLLDFTSATIDASGCPLFTFAGNPTGTPTTNTDPGITSNYATRQTSNCFAAPSAASAAPSPSVVAASGGQAVLVTRLGRERGPRVHGQATVIACVAARRLVFHINPVPHGYVVKAVAYVNGHLVARRQGRYLTTIAFARPRGSTLHVKIITTNDKGGQVITTRSFIGCRAKTKVKGTTRKHKVVHHKKKR